MSRRGRRLRRILGRWLGRSLDDGGFVAGGEVLILAVTVMALGALLIVELWSVLDTRIAVDDAAREAARAYVEAPDRESAVSSARRTALEILDGRGRLGEITTTIENLARSRCDRIAITVKAQVPRLVVPGVGSAGSYEVVGHHSELIDPYRSALELDGLARCDE